MASCISPITIPRPGYPDSPFKLGRLDKKNYQYDVMTVPCGKCQACLHRRQSDFAFRIRNEAMKYGSMVFLTLTYNDASIPLVQTLWRVSKDTGELERLSDPEFVCYSGREDFYDYREDFSHIMPSKLPRYLDVDIVDDDEYKYFSRITPSVCRSDVQKWLKRCRVYFERKENRILDFSYSITQEYGARFCRPHYHCCFMGLSESDVYKMASLWHYGFTKVEKVFAVNKDGSDGFGAVAGYVAKYTSKGDFRCECELSNTAFSCRQMNSKNLGTSVVDKLRPQVLCFDMVGEYDPDTFCSPTCRKLDRSQLALLMDEIPKRLVVKYGPKDVYAIPRIIRNRIFYVYKKSEDGKKEYCRPSRLWRMVVDHLQSINAELDRREFGQLLANKSQREIAQAVTSYNLVSARFAQTADDSRKENYKAGLQSSLF